MLFNSLGFLIFFPIVVLMYYVLPNRIRSYWLLAASYYFYMCWNAKYALLILFSTVATYLCGLAIEAARRKQESGVGNCKIMLSPKPVLALCIIVNLAILFFFKYVGFAFEILEGIASLLSIRLNAPAFDILLPVGISFYTFQALGYSIDVYRGDVRAEHNFFKYALFVSFFPQLVAGPIERSKNLLSQLDTPKDFDYDRAREGVLLMLWGFFLKIVIADRIALFVDTVYKDLNSYPGFYLILATAMFAIQIYCDFYGYSTIAMGAAKVLGVGLMENFDAPYLAVSVAQFWRRWHISLTSWFKDYLYIPLGGSRKGKMRKYLNKLIVFLVSGLWHGADFSFVAWGGLNGIYQIIAEILQPARDRLVQMLGIKREQLWNRILHMIGTFILVDISWAFFRASNFLEGLQVIGGIFTARNPQILWDGSIFQCGMDRNNFLLLLFCLLILLMADILKERGMKVREIIMAKPIWFRCIFTAVTIVFILTFGIWGGQYNEASFIYFQF